jgi:glycosyltransferase involved in cell wall biosynthesis
LHEERKGFQYVLDALIALLKREPCLKDNIHILIAGRSSATKAFLDNGIHFQELGYLNGDKKLAEAYQMSDFFVSASIEDSGPMMINESILCGTPVVSFEMGVAKDLVLTGKTGYLAKLKDVDDLALGIKYMIQISDDALNEMKSACRKLGLESTTEDIQTHKFMIHLSTVQVK